jgi:hypothetical protein
VVKKWDEAEEKRPTYYLDNDAHTYWYSATDFLVARAIQELPKEKQQRLHPFISDGKSREMVKRKHGLSMQPIAATLQINVSPAGIVQRIQTANGWTVLDSWMGQALHEGRFGFLIKGRDEVSLSGFSFTGSE